jgi:hypothetical protein
MRSSIVANGGITRAQPRIVRNSFLEMRSMECPDNASESPPWLYISFANPLYQIRANA